MRKIFQVLEDFDFNNEKYKQTVAEKIQYRPALEMEDGSTYEGQWMLGKGVKHGMGVTTYFNGDVHMGFYKNGKANGFGRGYMVSQTAVLEGNYVDGELIGEAFKYYHFGKYHGDYKDGTFNGKGHFHFYSGGSSGGEWKNGQFITRTVEDTMLEYQKTIRKEVEPNLKYCCDNNHQTLAI